ncbi:uncharacterized protein M8220_007578 isoform 2-T2 [Acridotheres tristis]
MRDQIDLLATVTVLGVLEQAYFAMQVIYARRKYKISPPETSGHPEFERTFRAQSHCTVRVSTRGPLLRAVSFCSVPMERAMLELNWKCSQIPSASSKHQIPSFISAALFCKRLKGIGWSWCEGWFQPGTKSRTKQLRSLARAQETFVE